MSDYPCLQYHLVYGNEDDTTRPTIHVESARRDPPARARRSRHRDVCPMESSHGHFVCVTMYTHRIVCTSCRRRRPSRLSDSTRVASRPSRRAAQTRARDRRCAHRSTMAAPPQGQIPTFKLILVGDGGTGARRRDETRRMRTHGVRTFGGEGETSRGMVRWVDVDRRAGDVRARV